jgi:hypothetical protein
MSKYLFNEDGEDFVVESKDLLHAKRNAEYYNAKLIGLLHEPVAETVFKKDPNYDWSKRIEK